MLVAYYSREHLQTALQPVQQHHCKLCRQHAGFVRFNALCNPDIADSVHNTFCECHR